MKTLVFEPLIPISVWASLAVASVLLLAWYGWDARRRLNRVRWSGVVALMSIALVLPLAILLNPQWVERIPPPSGKPLLSILVDSSASMATPDADDGATRYESAARIAAGLDTELGDRYEVKLATFAAAPTPAAAAELRQHPPDGAYTDLAAALQTCLQDDRAQGHAIVLLSDGIHNAGGGATRVLEAARLAKAMSAPVFCEVIGGATEVRDLAVEVRSPQELAFVGQRVPLRVEVRARGQIGPRARVSLWSGSQEVDSREIATSTNGRSEIEFAVRHDESGVFQYELRADGLPQEATLANNRSMFLLRVIDEPIRVLLLEGNPYWDSKFLGRTLSNDPSIELVSLVRMSEGRFMERTLVRAGANRSTGNPPDADTGKTPSQASITASADQSASGPAIDRRETWKILADPAPVLSAGSLKRYQIVVLGRDVDPYLTDDALNQMRRWITRDGGALVCFRGPPTSQVNERLRQFLPVRWNPGRESRFHMRLTESGRELRWIGQSDDPSVDVLAQLPSLATLASPGDVQPQAIVWAVGDARGKGDPNPVVSALPYGTGRVIVIEGAGMWRWAFLSPEFQRQEHVYATLWNSLVRWLVSSAGLLPSQKWALRSDKIRFSTGELATATLLVRETVASDLLPNVELVGGSLLSPQTFPVSPGGESGAYRVAFDKLPEGRYEAKIAGSDASDAATRTVFEVRSHVDEVLELTANVDLLSRIAEVSGGSLLNGTEAKRIATQVDEQIAQGHPDRIRKSSAWDRWWALAGTIFLWCASWGVRRRAGLI